MIHLSLPGLKVLPAGLTLLLFILLLAPVHAADLSGGVVDRYDDWEFENTPTVGMGIFPAVTLEPGEDTSLTISPVSPVQSSRSSSLWVTISPFTAELSGLETFMVVGYVSGARTGLTLTVEGKGASDSDFSDLTSIKPDENGLFVWAVPAQYQDLDLFRVTARSGSDQSLSNAIRFTAQPVDPVVKPVTPVQTIIPMQPAPATVSSTPMLTRLSLSASTTTPKVGEDVLISGRLTDQNGKGISGATIAIDETGYPGAQQAEPFATAVTGSDGRFDYTLSVRFADSVGLVATYDGDDTHRSAESNTLFFSAWE